MSRLAYYETSIVIPQRLEPRPDLRHWTLHIQENPCFDILQRALAKVAQDHGGTLLYGADAFYLDCRGHRHPCLIALHTADFPRGIGLHLTPQGRLAFAYDAAEEGETAGKFLVRPEVAQRICQEIAKHYVTIAVMRAQAKLGFRVSVQPLQPGGQEVVVQGVKP